MAKLDMILNVAMVVVWLALLATLLSGVLDSLQTADLNSYQWELVK